MIVTLIPGKKRIDVMPDESILEAALRAGASVRYQCNNGSCGQCKAQVLSGSVSTLYQPDYCLTSSEQQAHMCLMCVSAPGEDVLLKVDEAHSPDDIPLQKISARLARIRELEHGVYEITVRTPRSGTIWFLAGQTARLLWSNGMVAAAIASCPCNGMQLQFHFCKGMSRNVDLFLENAKKGMPLEIEAPAGNCVLDEQKTGTCVFICGDTGFAVAKSIIEHLIALDCPHPVRLYRYNGILSGSYLENYCHSWEQALDDYRYFNLGNSDTATLHSKLQLEPNILSSANFYISGTSQWIAGVSRVLNQVGIQQERLKVLATDEI